jgi:hypothetical protein
MGIFMEFISSRPDVVRSINQRWLLNYWNRLRAGAPLPKWQALEAEDLAASLESLSFQDVVGTDGSARFQIRFHGKRIAELYGRTNCVGKFLDEILPPSYGNAALATYRQAVSSRLPVYTIADMRDPRRPHRPLRTPAAAVQRAGRRGEPHSRLARDRQPRRRLRSPRPDGRAAKAAGFRALHNHPILRRNFFIFRGC